jgi:hypothetical protein
MKSIYTLPIFFILFLSSAAFSLDRTFYFKGIPSDLNSRSVRTTMDSAIECNFCITLINTDDSRVFIEFSTEAERMNLSRQILEGRVKSIRIKDFGLGGNAVNAKASQLVIESAEPSPVDKVQTGLIEIVAGWFEKLFGSGPNLNEHLQKDPTGAAPKRHQTEVPLLQNTNPPSRGNQGTGANKDSSSQ